MSQRCNPQLSFRRHAGWQQAAQRVLYASLEVDMVVRRGNIGIWVAALLALMTLGVPLTARAKLSRLAKARNVLAKRGSKAALRAFEKAAAHAPNDGAVWCELGWIASLAGQDERAGEALDKGLRLLAARPDSPSNARALGGCHFERAKLAERLGALATARQHYQASLDARPGDELTMERRDALDAYSRLQDGPLAVEKIRTRRAPAKIGARLPTSHVVASTYSRTNGSTLSYLPKNAVDGDKQTAWQVSNGGVGHWIQLHFDGTQPLARLGIVAGYDKKAIDRYGDRWPLNNRLSSIRLQWQSGEATASLDDRRGMQWVELPNVASSWLRIWITDVYAGSRWADTAISEIVVHRSPPPLVASGPPAPPAPTPANKVADPSAGAGADIGPHTDAANLDTERGSSSWLWWLLALGFVGAPLVARTKWPGQRELRTLLRRAKSANKAIAAEAQELGGVYADAVGASDSLYQGAPRIVAHIGEIRAALDRTRRMTSASAHEHRARLERQEQAAIARLGSVVERLEATAAQLAAQRAGQAMAGEIDRMLASLRREIDVAIAADEEARAILDIDASPFAVLRDGATPSTQPQSPS